MAFLAFLSTLNEFNGLEEVHFISNTKNDYSHSIEEWVLTKICLRYNWGSSYCEAIMADASCRQIKFETKCQKGTMSAGGYDSCLHIQNALNDFYQIAKSFNTSEVYDLLNHPFSFFEITHNHELTKYLNEIYKYADYIKRCMIVFDKMDALGEKDKIRIPLLKLKLVELSKKMHGLDINTLMI